ncbi:hypothetical protein HYDPIDRAFT_32566 [Hydnomerulius pinastri MD-312]|uniref:Uncharacterized protein n=1 Tax=Hydnomerulius pinastri MD-312 TaxID=994086 RepID=A0A0C9VQX8_9AGAM|nr:hypothetical protein HYDPIDRAFT_32566 [Hydnomerulius pinastri MD-312]
MFRWSCEPSDHSDILPPNYAEIVHEELKEEQYSSYSCLKGAVGSAYLNFSPSSPPSTNNLSPVSMLFPTRTPSVPVASPSSSSQSSETRNPSPTFTHASAELSYEEVFVPMPAYGPQDRLNWVKRVRMRNRPITNSIILFEPEPPLTQLGYRRTSCPSVSMHDCLSDDAGRSIMRDAEDLVFALMGATGDREVTFLLRWPGYTTLNWVRHIPPYVNGVPMTRSQLARFIAHEFRQFVAACDNGVFQTTDPAWKVGQGGVPFERMKLSSLWSPDDNVWVASVRVVGPNLNHWPQ